MYEQNVQVIGRIKYRGVILDTRLTYKFHLEVITIKAMRAWGRVGELWMVREG